MRISELAIRAQKLAIDNSPQLLTAIGVVGTVTTAVLTGHASYKAALLIHDERDRSEFRGWEPNRKELLEQVWKFYIPPAITGTFTIAAILGANHIGTRRAAGLAAAYSLSERAASEYREKVLEKIGPRKEQEIRDDLAQDRVSRTEGSREVIIIGQNVLFFDAYSGRFFDNNMESVRSAENTLNAEVMQVGYASLSDFYSLIGLPKTSASDEVGWNHEFPLAVRYSTTLSPDGRPCISIEYQLHTGRDYWKFGG